MSKKAAVQSPETKVIALIMQNLPTPVSTLLKARLKAVVDRATEITGQSYAFIYVLGKRVINSNLGVRGQTLIPGSIPAIREEFLELEKDIQTLEDDMLIIGNSLKAIMNLPYENPDILVRILNKVPKPLFSLLPEDFLKTRTHDNLVCEALLNNPAFQTQYARIEDKIHYYLATRYIV